MANDKISDAFPSSRTFDFKAGKKARIGLFSLADLIWVEETYGSLEEAVRKTGEAKGSMEAAKICWRLCENKADFGADDASGLAVFMELAPIATFVPGAVIQWAVSASMPEQRTGGGKKGN